MTKREWFTNSLMLATVLACTLGQTPNAFAKEIDLTKAVVVVPDGLSGPENKAARLLVDEVRNRSRLEWDVSLRWPTRDVPVIALGPARLFDTFPRELRERIPGLAPGKEKEGFRIETNAGGDGVPVVAIVGNDERGVLFGVGRLLRELHLALAGMRSLAKTGWPPPRSTLSEAIGARVSSQDQFVRRLGRRAVGSIHSRPGCFRLQCDRVDSPSFRRCGQ